MARMAALEFSCTLQTAAATRAAAKKLGAGLPPGSVIGLIGELGAGKTTFVQGLARGLKVHDLREVCSPTYGLLHEYPAARYNLIHLDYYRLKDVDAARALGIEEQLWRKDCVVAIEWADRFKQLCPPHTIWLTLTAAAGTARRCEVWGLADPGRFFC